MNTKELCAEIDRLVKINNDWASSFDRKTRVHDKCNRDYVLLRQKHDTALVVLKYYAADDTYSKGEFGMYLDDGDCFLDDYVKQSSATEHGGRQARDVLELLGQL